jgi:ATP-dependent exoDNAse (exonuclease V) beta subunit
MLVDKSTMALLKEQNEHVRDARIVFDEAPHIYYIDGECEGYVSTTTFIHHFFGKFDADVVIANMRRGKKWNDKNKYYGMSDDEIKDGWELNKVEACEAGTHLHKCIELFYNQEPIENNSIEYEMFKKFEEEHQHLTPYRTEWEVFFEEYKLAGSIDMIFKHADGTYSIYDWKRSKEIKKTNYFNKGLFPLNNLDDCNYIHYTLQLNIYKFILTHKYGLKIRDMYLVCLHPNQSSYKLYEVYDKHAEISNMLLERKNQLEQ